MRKTLLIILGLLVAYYIYHAFSTRNPFDDVAWIEDTPGATERFVEFTPVLRSDKSKVIGPSIGADFARLRFKDLDGDGVKEAIIETHVLVDLGKSYIPERHILKYQKGLNGLPEFVLVEEADLNQETLRDE